MRASLGRGSAKRAEERKQKGEKRQTRIDRERERKSDLSRVMDDDLTTRSIYFLRVTHLDRARRPARVTCRRRLREREREDRRGRKRGIVRGSRAASRRIDTAMIDIGGVSSGCRRSPRASDQRAESVSSGRRKRWVVAPSRSRIENSLPRFLAALGKICDGKVHLISLIKNKEKKRITGGKSYRGQNERSTDPFDDDSEPKSAS